MTKAKTDIRALPQAAQKALRELPPQMRSLVLKAMAMKFRRRGADPADFIGEKWRERCDAEQMLHLSVVKIMGMTDVELTQWLADSEMQETAGELMVTLANRAKAFEACRDMFMYGSMRLLCAYARNEFKIGRDGKPLADREAS